eukprot:g4475.t1
MLHHLASQPLFPQSSAIFFLISGTFRVLRFATAVTTGGAGTSAWGARLWATPVLEDESLLKAPSSFSGPLGRQQDGWLVAAMGGAAVLRIPLESFKQLEATPSDAPDERRCAEDRPCADGAPQKAWPPASGAQGAVIPEFTSYEPSLTSHLSCRFDVMCWATNCTDPFLINCISLLPILLGVIFIPSWPPAEVILDSPTSRSFSEVSLELRLKDLEVNGHADLCARKHRVVVSLMLGLVKGGLQDANLSNAFAEVKEMDDVRVLQQDFGRGTHLLGALQALKEMILSLVLAAQTLPDHVSPGFQCSEAVVQLHKLKSLPALVEGTVRGWCDSFAGVLYKRHFFDEAVFSYQEAPPACQDQPDVWFAGMWHCASAAGNRLENCPGSEARKVHLSKFNWVVAFLRCR